MSQPHQFSEAFSNLAKPYFQIKNKTGLQVQLRDGMPLGSIPSTTKTNKQTNSPAMMRINWEEGAESNNAGSVSVSSVVGMMPAVTPRPGTLSNISNARVLTKQHSTQRGTDWSTVLSSPPRLSSSQ